MNRGLTDFLGIYDVSRVIKDRRACQESQFEGRAEITETPGGALYSEKGALILSGQRFEAERTYNWHQTKGRIWVQFDDGTPFHDFDPVQGGLASEHLCGEDMYKGGYDFSEWSCWSLTWDVLGPRKDYRSVTWYVRL